MRLVVDQGGKIDPDLKQIVEAGVRGKHVGQRLFRHHGMEFSFQEMHFVVGLDARLERPTSQRSSY